MTMIDCSCGGTYTKRTKSRHMSSEKHCAYAYLMTLEVIEHFKSKQQKNRERALKYYHEHKDQKKHIQCKTCGAVVLESSVHSHLKSKKHRGLPSHGPVLNKLM